MPQPDNEREPSALVLHFGAELRHHRTQAKLSLDQLGTAMGYTAQWISQVELAKRAPSEKFAIDLDTQFKTDGNFHRHWEAIKKDDRRRVLLPGFNAYLEAETQAACIRAFQAQVVPGLLQIEQYARAVSSAGRRPAALEEWVTSRLERQRIFQGDAPPRVFFILDESVLHRPVGGKATMREQLQVLADLVDSPSTHLHLLPYSAVNYAGYDGSFILLQLNDGGELLYQEGPGFGQLIDDPDIIASCKVRFDIIMGEALSRRETHKTFLRTLEALE